MKKIRKIKVNKNIFLYAILFRMQLFTFKAQLSKHEEIMKYYLIWKYDIQ